MKILQIGKFYYPFLGGIETVERTLSEGLVARGHSVTVLCADHKTVFDKTSQSNRHSQGSLLEEEIAGVRVLRAPSFGTLFSQPICPSMPLKILANLNREIAKPYDLIHVHSPHPLVELTLAMLKRKVPWLVTYHSDVIRQRWIAPVYNRMLHLFLKKVDGIIAASTQNVDFSPVLQKVRSKCGVVPFGIEPEPFKITQTTEIRVEQLRKKYGRFVLFTGRMVPYKGVDVLLRAIAMSGPIRAVLIGEGPLLHEWIELAKNLGISGKVDFLGRVSGQDEVVAHLHACDAFVLPSVERNEAFGMVLLEAMACGKPLISTQIPSGVRFVNEDGVTGIQVPPGNASDLMVAIEKIIQNDDLRNKMGLAARKRFEKHFTAESMIAAYEKYYFDYVST